MGHESQIELWSPNLTTFCFAGFGTDRLRCQEATKTAVRENPKRWAIVLSNRAHGAVGPNSSRSIVWAEKQEKFQLKEKGFFLTSTFIELSRNLSIKFPGIHKTVSEKFAALATRQDCSLFAPRASPLR